MFDDDSLAPAKEILTTDNLEVSFEAERYKGSPLADTVTEIKGTVTISWQQREDFVRELQEVIEKYKL